MHLRASNGRRAWPIEVIRVSLSLSLRSNFLLGTMTWINLWALDDSSVWYQKKKIVVFLNAEEVHSMPVLFHCHSAYCQDFITPLLTDYSTIFMQIKVKQMQVWKQTVSNIKHDGTTPNSRCFNLSIIALTSFMVTWICDQEVGERGQRKGWFQIS